MYTSPHDLSGYVTLLITLLIWISGTGAELVTETVTGNRAGTRRSASGNITSVPLFSTDSTKVWSPIVTVYSRSDVVRVNVIKCL